MPLTFLGRLGNREGINVAKVEVTWFNGDTDESGSGYYVVHATGDEPECQGEYGSVYNVFEDLVHGAMQAKIDAGEFTSYDLEDTSSL